MVSRRVSLDVKNPENDAVAEDAPAQAESVASARRTARHPAKKARRGISPWIRGDLLKLEKRHPNYEYRWCAKDNPVKMAQREAMGFEKVTRISGHGVENVGQPRIQDATPTTDGVTDMGDLVLMALPKELADERREAVADYCADKMLSLADDVDSQLGRAGAPRHGGIKVESREGVIEV